MFSGFPAAIIDVAEVDRMSGRELCEKAESMGVDLHRFEVRQPFVDGESWNVAQ